MKISSADPEANRLGPMFGSPLTGGEKEGLGPGRCFAVTIGGHSDGHNATVLHASFHPELNILATSGVDHCIKMWSFDLPPPPTAPEAVLVNLVRPIFSTKFLHHAMVSCIHWLSPSLLVSQSAQSQTAEQEPFPAKLVVWKWLAYQTYKNVVTSGYEYVKDSLNATDSHSYKVLAEISLAYAAQRLSISQKLIILPSRSYTLVLDPSCFNSRARPTDSDNCLVESDLHHDDPAARTAALDRKKRQIWEHAVSEGHAPSSASGVAIIPLEDVEEDTIFSAAMSHGMLLRVGNKERLRVWRLRLPTSSSTESGDH